MFDLARAKKLLSVPGSFTLVAQQFPAKVDEALSLLNTVDDVAELLSKTDAIEHYAKRVKIDVETTNCITYGRLKIEAKLGELAKAPSASERGKKGGRGHKAPVRHAGALPPDTAKLYRKVAKDADRITEYFEATKITDQPVEMSTAGFLRFCNGSGVHVTNNSGENEWYTPHDFIERARRTMGGIDLDPASCDEAQKIVKAKRFYSLEDDGLTKKWKGRVWMNPPYSKDSCPAFTAKLLEHAAAGDISQACVLVNNATETAWLQPLLAACAAACFPAGRIKFHDKTGKPANSPLQGQVILYFGEYAREFEKHFSDIGPVLFDDIYSAAEDGPRVSSADLTDDSDLGGDSPDRIEWVADKIANLWLSYVNKFGPEAELFAFVAGLENWQARTE